VQHNNNKTGTTQVNYTITTTQVQHK